jgi:hypothetical protein
MIKSFDRINPALFDPSPEIAKTLDSHPGYTDAMKAADTPDVLRDVCGAAVRDFTDDLWIEPKDWKDKAAENDKNHTWGINFLDRFTNQNPTHECTCHALRACAEAARNRQRGIIFPEGPKRDFRYEESAKGSVWLSPLSIYAEANPRQWGGAGCHQVLEIACRRGFLPEKIQPREYGFKHTLAGTTGAGGKNQSRGDWVPVSRFPDGFEETGKLLKPAEVIIPSSWEQGICLLLHGGVGEVGRSGHAIPYAFWNAEEDAVGYVDSYDVVRYDSRRTYQSAMNGIFFIMSMTTPDDWNNPAGIP